MTHRMNWHVVHLEDVKPTLWRNGGGTTRELVARPDAQHWKWRASVAEVHQPGAFSSFPGVQRWFAVLSGEGVCLNVGGDSHTLKSSDAPLAFDGAAQTTCQLLGGATQDFNLMVQGGAKASMKRVLGGCQAMAHAAKIIAFYADNTPAIVLFGTQRFEVVPHTFAWMYFDEATAFELQTNQALLMEIDA